MGLYPMNVRRKKPSPETVSRLCKNITTEKVRVLIKSRSMINKTPLKLDTIYSEMFAINKIQKDRVRMILVNLVKQDEIKSNGFAEYVWIGKNEQH